ncbi:MAG: histidinol-phosphate transaminase [Betaproteobacteria bacterium]|nr:histidinol-phosphate transaminase [Betaproteobacteria bacterium]MDE2624769.1 histidinol-phosphate transaminase [Betaproteobacteria bacterium]
MTDLCELVPGHIRGIAPYQPGKPISELERELGLTRIIKLASNENPLGPSPRALEAIRGALPELALYPDGNGFELKSALARRFSLTREQVVLGNGSNDVLELAARTFLGPGTSAVFSEHAFAVYPLVTQAVGATGIEVPARNFAHDLEAMIAAIRPDTRILFVANPNNPTGSLIAGPMLRAALERVPSRVLIVLDEAYTEYLEPAHRYDAVTWLHQRPNLLISRTFSKAYGLAGLRVGFGLARPAVIDLMNRVRQPFNVSSLALVAAQAALGDLEFLERTRALNTAGLAQLAEGFRRLGLSFIPSHGNFLSVEVGDSARIYQSLLRQGIIVRPVAGYRMPRHLRISVGLPEENAACLAALERALQEAP